MTILCRLLHVSDLHFGDVLFTPWWALWNQIPGLETHNAHVVRELSNSVRSQSVGHTPIPPIATIATGDLTTWGRPSAFNLVFKYLRDQLNTRNQQAWAGLNDPDASVVPGNHDIWNGAPLGLSPLASLPPLSQTNFARFFNLPSPSADYPHPQVPFPYQLRIHKDYPAIYLYGLDSTRVDLIPNAHIHSAFAEGFVDQQQLKYLELLVNNESYKPCLRIIAIHHPLAYMQTTGIPKMQALINLDSDILPTLQKLGFSIALCGHQHQGFIRQVSVANSTYPPIYVFSTGTSTQTINLSFREKQIFSRPYTSLNTSEQNQWLLIARKCNEYRSYDFEINPKDNNKITVTVHSYIFNPNLFTFSEINTSLRPVEISLVQN